MSTSKCELKWFCNKCDSKLSSDESLSNQNKLDRITTMLETLLAQTGSIDGRVQELETSKQAMENQIQELEKGLQVKADKSAVMNIDDRLKQLEQQIQSNEPEQASQGTIRTTVETMVNKQLGED